MILKHSCYQPSNLIPFLEKRFYLFTFRQRGKGGEIEGETFQCVVTFHKSPTGDLVHNPGMCPDWELNW